MKKTISSVRHSANRLKGWTSQGDRLLCVILGAAFMLGFAVGCSL